MKDLTRWKENRLKVTYRKQPATSIKTHRPSSKEREHSAWVMGRVSVLVRFFFFGPHGITCGILVPRPGIQPARPALEGQSLNHWITGKSLAGEILMNTGSHLDHMLNLSVGDSRVAWPLAEFRLGGCYVTVQFPSKLAQWIPGP